MMSAWNGSGHWMQYPTRNCAGRRTSSRDMGRPVSRASVALRAEISASMNTRRSRASDARV
jgi:hypothetical protein